MKKPALRPESRVLVQFVDNYPFAAVSDDGEPATLVELGPSWVILRYESGGEMLHRVENIMVIEAISDSDYSRELRRAGVL